MPTLVGLSLALLGVALAVGGYEMNAHTPAAGGASVSAGVAVLVGYLIVLAAVVIAGVGGVSWAVRRSRGPHISR